ncbi:MAG: hypothetical protein JOZ23_05110, partial [Mycobacterium sp.]|nr:hypothetical protein [Mycobacterium sp.]
LVGVSLAIWLRSRKVRIDHTNVNDEWEGSLTAGLESADQPAVGARVPVGAPSGLGREANGQTPQPRSAAAQTVVAKLPTEDTRTS